MNIFPKMTNLFLTSLIITATPLFAQSQNSLSMNEQINVLGQTKPIPVSLDGFTGEAAEVLKFDLYVQGFSFVSPDAAQYVISGGAAGNVTGSVTDKFAKRSVLSRTYNGASLRRQAHAFADDVVQAIQNKKGIGQTKIAYKSQPSGYGPGEIYVSDFDGWNATRITTDNAIVAKPAWVPGKLALYYTSYALDNPDIFYHSLTTGQRRKIACYSGLNTSAAVSPDGAKIAMVLSKSGSANVWTCGADGSNLKQLTHGVQDSSPCWSPDGEWICFATEINGRRRLAKIPAAGGTVHPLNTTGAANPTEPDWSPDGKWIAFTSQMGDFNVCVMPADGGAPPSVLVGGQNPSWAPNSRTLVFNRPMGYRQVLSVLDVFTKQYKDGARATGSNSQPAWAK